MSARIHLRALNFKEIKIYTKKQILIAVINQIAHEENIRHAMHDLHEIKKAIDNTIGKLTRRKLDIKGS